MQAASTDVFHDQNHIFSGVDDLVKANDVLVAHFLHEFNLALDRFAPVRLH